MADTPQELPERKEISAEEFIIICKGGYASNPTHSNYYRKQDGILKSVVIKNHYVSGQVVFNVNEYSNAFVIENTEFEQELIFESAIFLKRIGFNNCFFKNGIHFIEPTFNYEISIKNSTVKDNLRISGGNYTGTFSIDINKKNKPSDDLSSVVIQGGEFNKLVIGANGSNLRSVDMLAINVKGNVFIAGKDSIIENVFIRSLSRHLMLYLEDFNVNMLSIQSFNSSVKFKIHNIKAISLPNKESEFLVQNSNLGSAEISTVDLSKFDIVNIRDSYISDVNFVNTIWNNNITSFDQSGSQVIKEITDIREYNFKNRDVYRQLKYASSKYGDTVTSFEFLAKEMEIYRKYLKNNNNKLFSKEWWNNKAERANLWLNMFSNYYGNNWLKAVFLTLFFNTMLYTFYCWSQGYWFGNDWNKFWTLAAYSFEFLNPLRKADFLQKVTGEELVPPAAIAIDYVSRIIIAYFVYQTITAFRKFGKRSA